MPAPGGIHALAGGCDDVRHHGIVARRHDVAAGDMRDVGQLATMSRQMRRPSAAGSLARSRRSTIASGMMAPYSLSLIQRADLAERSGTMPTMNEQLVGKAVLGKPRHVAAHHAGIHAELRLHELRAGGDLGGKPLRLPAGRRIDRIVGGAEEEIRRGRRPCGRTAIRPCRAAGARSRAAGADRDRTPAWRRAGRRRSDRRRAASACCARRRPPRRSDRSAGRCGCGRGR